MLKRIHDFWHEARLFSFNNRTFLETIFLSVYTVEQALLIFFTELVGVNSVVISYFALVVLFTFAIHKTTLESRMRLLEDNLRRLKSENSVLKQKVREMNKKYRTSLIVYYENLVKKSQSFNTLNDRSGN